MKISQTNIFGTMYQSSSRGGFVEKPMQELTSQTAVPDPSAIKQGVSIEPPQQMTESNTSQNHNSDSSQQSSGRLNLYV
jgi:hypothetical protein